jgi:hypothetical protein
MSSGPHATAPQYAHELRPGAAYAPLRFRISAEVNQQYLFALEDYAAPYLGDDDDPPIVHPVLLLHMSARTRSPSFVLAPGMGSVFAQDRVTFHRAARVGEWLDVHWTIRDVYARKGRLYQALATTVVGEDAMPVLTREAHSLFFTRSGVALPLPGEE